VIRLRSPSFSKSQWSAEHYPTTPHRGNEGDRPKTGVSETPVSLCRQVQQKVQVRIAASAVVVGVGDANVGEAKVGVRFTEIERCLSKRPNVAAISSGEGMASVSANGANARWVLRARPRAVA
jgi:hypothetical protein